MSYSDFDLETVIEKFRLSVVDASDYFEQLPPITPSERLTEQLSEGIPLARNISTEKARSELIVMPILLEVRRQLGQPISIFSGTTFNVAPELGLSGVCDFIVSLSPSQIVMQAPVVSLVEAKNDNLKLGMGQCVAEMLAAQRFNEAHNRSLSTIYGVVTTGVLWRLLRLIGAEIGVDSVERSIDLPEKILGLLIGVLQETLQKSPMQI